VKPAFTREDAEYLRALAEKIVAKFQAVPCRGEIAKVAECTSEYEQSCELREDHGCAKNLVRWDESRRQEVLSVRERLNRLGVPRPLAEQLGDRNYRPSEALDSAIDWFQSKPRPSLLLLMGGTGIGKTFAAGHLLTLIPNGQMIHAFEFYQQRRSEESFLALQSASFLVLDDLGCEPPDGFEEWRRTVATLLGQRLDMRMESCITTNLSAKEFRDRYGDRLADRIRAYGKVALLTGKSLRKG